MVPPLTAQRYSSGPMMGTMLARIAILSLLAVTLCPASLIYELRLTGTVMPGGSVNTRLLNGSTQLEPLDNARVEVLIELDFDLRPPVVINALGGGDVEYLYASTAFSPEWITRVRFTFLNFPVFSESLPISNVWELSRMPPPPGATELTPSEVFQEASALDASGLQNTRIVKRIHDDWTLGAAVGRSTGFVGLIIAGLPVFFDDTSIRPFANTALSGPTLGFSILERANTGNPADGQLGEVLNRRVSGAIAITSVEGRVPEPGTYALMAAGLALLVLRRRNH